MKKQGLTSLILRICSAVVAVFSFIALAFQFAFVKVGSESQNIKNFKDFADSLDDMQKAKDLGIEIKGLSQWQACRVFGIIALVLVAIVAVIAIVQLFWNHKILNYALWAVAGLTVVCALLFIILFAVGANAYFGDAKGVSYGPSVGAMFMCLCPIIASALAVVPTFLKSKNA